MRVYPAYGRTIASHLVRGNHPVAIGVLLSSRWWYFDHVAKICVSPDEWALGRWEFGYLHNQHVVVVAGDGASDVQLGELLIELMLAGPRLVWVRDIDRWLYHGSSSYELSRYADDLTGRKHHGLTLLALDKYEDAQLRELGLLQREAARAAELKRTAVPFVAKREAARAEADRIFSSSHQAVDEHAA